MSYLTEQQRKISKIHSVNFDLNECLILQIIPKMWADTRNMPSKAEIIRTFDHAFACFWNFGLFGELILSSLEEN